MKLNKYNNKGITLIALIITIIVLLILAGITIGMLTSDSGVLKQGTNARKDTIVGQEKQYVELAYNTSAISTLGDFVTAKDVQKELDKSVGENKTKVSGAGRLKVKFLDTGNEYIINQDGNIEKYIRMDPTPVYANVCDTDGDGKGETLVLSSTENIEGYTITNNYGLITERTSLDYSYYGTNKQRQITKIVIYDKISPTSTAYWFDALIELTEIDNIGNLDTSNATNMSSMFSGCSKLTELDVSHWDTSKLVDASSLFSNCKLLETLDVSGFDTSEIISFSGMFAGCENLKHLDVSGFDTSKATDMRSMFSSCTNLEEIDVSSFDTSNVTVMSWMFGECRKLTTLDLSNFNTSNVTKMVSMFNNCRNLERINLSSFNTSNVQEMNSIFYCCEKLKDLDLRSFNTSNVINMESMFNFCKALEELDLSSFDTANVTNMKYMFSSCINLNTILVSDGFVTSGLSESQAMFVGCSSLVGGSGTTFQNYVHNSTYAHIDGGTENPGYFTAK